jgi:hypothetical protein
MRREPLIRPDVRLGPWSDRAFAELGVSGMSERSESPLRSLWHTTLVRRGKQGPPLVDVRVETRTLGPLALRRTVRLKTSDSSVCLELGRGLELGVGMPKWLRRARAFAGDEAIGTLEIGRGSVALTGPPGEGQQGAWSFEGRLLGYVGLPEPVAYGAVCWAGRSLGELLAPRLHTYHEALVCGSVPLWRGVGDVIDGPSRRWMLALTALVAYYAAAGQEWHSHQPGQDSH